MAGPEFWQTVMGRRFIEGTVPNLVQELKKLNENLEVFRKFIGCLITSLRIFF